MTSLRAQKKRATAQGLADAAYALATLHGFESVTTDDIASNAGVSRRTFANYYPNKHAAVVDGFIQHLGIPIVRRDDPVDPGVLPETFDELVDSAQSFISGVFTEGSRSGHMQKFARMVKENPGLEPYIHAVFLEFQNSHPHRILSERFGPVKVSLFIGAAIGTLGATLRLVLGPHAIHRDTPPLRRMTAAPEQSESQSATSPILTPEDITKILSHIDHAFTYLRHGFADQ